jgi:hypothetical protein
MPGRDAKEREAERIKLKAWASLVPKRILIRTAQSVINSRPKSLAAARGIVKELE